MHTRHLLATVVIAALGVCQAAAQGNGTNSSYSRFGLGLPSDQSQSYNRSMGGVAQGLRAGNRINKQNPASYSAIDSLSFLFDVGMNLQRTRMKQGGKHQSANNTAFDYVTAGFRLRRNLGMSLGFVPFTNIGYSFTQTETVTEDPMLMQRITQTIDYSGSGGLHEVYGGIGWQPLNGFSLGFNIGYLWGSLSHFAIQTFAEDGTTNTANYGSLTTAYSSNTRTWKAEVGAQYRFVANPTNRFTIGATVGIGHTIGSEALVLRTSLQGDTIPRSTRNAFKLPMTYSLGLGWEHAERLLVAADATMEQWKDCTTPQIQSINGGSDIAYVAMTGAYTNRWRVNAGAEYVPARYDAAYVRRINYRIGAAYSTPYLKINGLEGPSEFSLTAGIGLPITNTYNSRSYVNVGVQWTRRSASAAQLITENTFRLNIALSFNESWFMKWKFR